MSNIIDSFGYEKSYEDEGNIYYRLKYGYKKRTFLVLNMFQNNTTLKYFYLYWIKIKNMIIFLEFYDLKGVKTYHKNYHFSKNTKNL